MGAKDLFHIDPITIVVVLCGFIGTWYTLRNDSKWHTAWIKKHDEECNEQRKTNTKILTEIQTTNAHLVTMAENQEKRIDRVEKFVDAH